MNSGVIAMTIINSSNALSYKPSPLFAKPKKPEDEEEKGLLEKNKKLIDEATANDKEKFKKTDLSKVNKKTSEDLAITKEIKDLQDREDMIIKHERSHMAVGGNLASSPSYIYTTGPDGKKYISGGEVSMRLPTTGSFEKMLANVKKVVQASTAGINPSPTDIKTAALAVAMESKITNEMTLKKAKESYEKAKEISEVDKQIDPQTKDLKDFEKTHIDELIEDSYTSKMSKMKFKSISTFEMFI